MIARDPLFFVCQGLKCGLDAAGMFTPGKAGAQPFDPALRDLRMNCTAAQFTSSALTELDGTRGGHGMRWSYEGNGWRSEDRLYKFQDKFNGN